MATNDLDRNLQVEVPLPPSVEEFVKGISAKHQLPPLSADERRKLAADGEEEALRILRIIATSTTVRSFPGFIAHLRRQSPSPPSPSSSSRCSSLFPPPSKIPRLTPQALATEALGELEFRKQFVILNYFAGNELDKVTSAEEIRSFKDLPMAQFEEQLWERYGRIFVDEEDRVSNSDWDLKRTHVYHCHVSKEGSFIFKGPFLEKTRTHLHNVLDDDNVLMVKFANTHDPHNAGYDKIAKKGIPVGLRLYRFFVFKDGGKEEKNKSSTSSSVKCYFVRTLSEASIAQNASYILSNKTICEARQLFMHAHTVPNVSNYMARFSLILSKTHKLEIDLSSVNVTIIEDVRCKDESGNPVYRDGKPLIHTDGTGFISEDLALLCPKNLFKGQCINNENIELGRETRDPPLLIQFRMFYNGYAVKGTLLVNKKLAPRTIQIRNSMIKVEPDPVSKHPTVNSLEIVRTSNPPKETFLSTYLIALLSHGGFQTNFSQIYFRKLSEKVVVILATNMLPSKLLRSTGTWTLISLLQE